MGLNKKSGCLQNFTCITALRFMLKWENLKLSVNEKSHAYGNNKIHPV